MAEAAAERPPGEWVVVVEGPQGAVVDPEGAEAPAPGADLGLEGGVAGLQAPRWAEVAANQTEELSATVMSVYGLKQKLHKSNLASIDSTSTHTLWTAASSIKHLLAS